ncbi:hypothetical protein ACTA71_011623 [Dictyostelium dimigraforme]
MEENLISWILKDDEDIFKRERIIKAIKKISDSGVHITIKSLLEFLDKKKTSIFTNEKEIDCETLNIEFENEKLLNQLQKLLFVNYENANIRYK